MSAKLATRALVTAMVVLGVVAAVDALRRQDRDRDVAPRATTFAADAATVEALRAAEVRGTLIWSDDVCGLHAHELPSLTPTEPPQSHGGSWCNFSVSRDGTLAADAAAAYEPTWDAVALCRDGRTFVRGSSEPSPDDGYEGCAPAWQRDGDLTLVRAGSIIEVESGRVLVPRATVRRAAERHPGAPGRASLRVEIVDVAWLTEWRPVTLLALTTTVRARQPVYGVAFFERGAVDDVRALVAPTPLRLEASATGRFVAVLPQLLLRRDGSEISLPDALTQIEAIAFSPDEQWIAVATRKRLYLLRASALDLFDRRSRPPPAIRLPLVAADVAWR